MSKPLVDITTLNAIESLFQHGTHDPWGRRLAGEFADLFIYSDIIRYPINVLADSFSPGSLPKRPSVLLDLTKRDSDSFQVVTYSTQEPFRLKDEYLEDSFDQFAVWARNNKRALRQWLTVHSEKWARTQYRSRVPHQYIFALDKLLNGSTLKSLAKELKSNEAEICYAFDIVLRYPLYGEFTGENNYYLNHPIRNAFSNPTMKEDAGPLPVTPVSFKDSIASLVPNISQDEYIVLLHELRGQVRDSGLHRVKPGDFDKEAIRDIAAKVALPPRVKIIAKAAAIGAGVIGGLGAFPVLGPSAAVAGAIVSVTAALWSGRLPRSVGRLRWLRWALEWDIENQAEKRD